MPSYKRREGVTFIEDLRDKMMVLAMHINSPGCEEAFRELEAAINYEAGLARRDGTLPEVTE